MPPHILVTTPESLYLLLTSEKSRKILRTVNTVIVDEIHALARDKRGSHLTLSLERLAQLCEQPLARIGLSATQRPMDEIAQFLVGGNSTCELEHNEPCFEYKTQPPMPLARSSTLATSAIWIWRWRFRRAKCRPFARTNNGARFTNGWWS